MAFPWTALISLHVVAAVAWIGGMLFLSLVLAPLVRQGHDSPERRAMFRSAARRFRPIAWAAILILLVTGPILLAQRQIGLRDPSAWPNVLAIKLGLVAGLLVMTVAHDLFLGPKVAQIMAKPARANTSWEQIVVNSSRWLPRLSLVVALAIIVAAAILARSS